jgi:PKD repeat protein
MNNIKAMVFALLLVLMSPAAFALVWQDPYWLPVGTADPNTIAFGGTATAASGAFSSIDTTVHYRAELRRNDGTLMSVLEEHDVDISVYTGYETVDIPQAAYVNAGEYWVRFTVSDSHQTENKQLRLVVSPGPANHPPVLNLIADRTVNENSLLTFTVSGSDPDGDTISFSAANMPSGAAFNAATRTFSWTPTFDQSGTYHVTFTVTDEHGATDSQSMTITVLDVNRCPVLSPIGGKTTTEGQLLSFSILASDADGTALTYSASGLPSGANFNAATRTFSWNPGSSQSGTYFVTFTVTDGSCPDSETVRIDVADDSSPVVTINAVPSAGPEGVNVSFICTAVGGDAPLSYIITFGDGTSVSSSTGSHVYPIEGSYVAVCTATDSDGDSGSDSVDVLVGDNEPVVDLVATPVSGDAPLSVAFTCNVAGGNAPYVYVIDFGDGNFANSASATHIYSSEGIYVATCTVVDIDGDSGSDTVGITVSDNDCPVMALLSNQNVQAGNTLTFTVSASDADGDALTYSADAPFSGFVNAATGVFSWTPVPLQVGDHLATFRVSDGICSDSQTIHIVVTAAPVNHVPNAEFNWTPASPSVGQNVHFTSTSTDPDGDSLSCAWDFDADGFTDSTSCVADYMFTTPGDHAVTLTVSDGSISDSVTHIITVLGQLNVTGITCFSPVIEDSLQSCSVRVDAGGVAVGGVNVQLYLLNGTRLNNCVTDTITGNCVVSFPSGDVGNYTVYATAQKSGWLPDLDTYPRANFQVLARRYLISNLAVYNNSAFSNEDYDFFRGEDMYVHFIVLDETGVPADHMVTSVALISPPGGVAWFTEFPHAHVPGNYYYSLRIPTTHDFLGDSQVFTFAFNFTDGSGAQMVVEVVIRNNPPVIGPAVSGEFARTFNGTASIDLTPYESDVEDSGSGLQWSVLGADPAIAEISVDINDVLTVTPRAAGYDIITLVLRDLDGATDTIDVPINTGSFVLPQCSDGVDNDGDGLVDMLDPGCSDSSDNNESNPVVLHACNDGLDNDGDGLIDMFDPGCSNSSDDDEFNGVVLHACNDGLDNDGDGLIDMLDPGCTSPSDDDETNAVVLPDCNDGVDNDGDGLVDLADPGCVNLADDDETNSVHIPQCADSVDNDGDSLIDLLDPGCVDASDDDETNTVVLPQCSDGVDNDGDGKIDLADPGCVSVGDGDETDPIVIPQCADGLDNDGDGLVDMEDPDCSWPGDNSEQHLAQCADGFDNDADGLVDLLDPGCTNASDDDEFDLAGNQPPVADLRLSRDFGAPSIIVDVDGSHSYDPDGAIAEHSWVIIGPGNYTYENLHVAGAPSGFAVQFNSLGTYEIRLTVVDNLGAADTEIKTVTIGNYPQCNNGLDDDKDGKVDWPADLHCSDRNDPNEGEILLNIPKHPFRDMDDLLVTRIDLNGHDVESAAVAPGNVLRLGLGLQNSLAYTLDDIKVDVSVQELGIRSSDMLRELDPDESANVVLELEIPEDVEPGLYDLRVVVSNDDVRRVKYRVLAIV